MTGSHCSTVRITDSSPIGMRRSYFDPITSSFQYASFSLPEEFRCSLSSSRTTPRSASSSSSPMTIRVAHSCRIVIDYRVRRLA